VGEAWGVRTVLDPWVRRMMSRTTTAPAEARARRAAVRTMRVPVVKVLRLARLTGTVSCPVGPCRLTEEALDGLRVVTRAGPI
jgi:hypothetical protein